MSDYSCKKLPNNCCFCLQITSPSGSLGLCASAFFFTLKDGDLLFVWHSLTLSTMLCTSSFSRINTGNESLQLHKVAWILRKTMGRKEQNDKSPFFPSPALPSHVLITKAEFGLKQNFLFDRKPHFVSTPKQKPVLCLVVFPEAGVSSFTPRELLPHFCNTTRVNLQ